MKKAVIILGIVSIVGIGLGFYLYKTQNKLEDKDFDGVVNLSKNKGYDIFDGLSADKLKLLRTNYLKKFNRASHNEMLNLLSLGEKAWSPSQKIEFNQYISKLRA
jgi:hypothetical protein